jgi:hypothetical protein
MYGSPAYQHPERPDHTGSAKALASHLEQTAYDDYASAGPQALAPFETSEQYRAVDPSIVHAPPPEWTPGGRPSRSRTHRLFAWLARLSGALVSVSVSFLVVVALWFGILPAAVPSYHHNLVEWELVWMISFGSAALISSFLGGLVAKSRNRAEAAGLLGCAGVVTILGLSAHHTPGASKDVTIPGLLAVFDFFLPLCLVLVGAALGARVARRTDW